MRSFVRITREFAYRQSLRSPHNHEFVHRQSRRHLAVFANDVFDYIHPDIRKTIRTKYVYERD